jgi:hypothetical protein
MNLERLVFLGISAMCLYYGVRMLFDKEWAWRRQERDNRSRGVLSYRTPEWERRSTGSGYLMIGVAVALAFLAFI